MLNGVVVIQSRGELGHSGLTLTVDGSVSLQLSAKSVGMFEAFYNSLKVNACWVNNEYLASLCHNSKSDLQS